MNVTIYIVAKSRYGKEIIDETRDSDEAARLVSEYRLAFGNEFTITSTRRPGLKLLSYWRS